MADIYHIGQKGLMVCDGKSPPRQVHDEVAIELPPGEWHMQMIGVHIVLVDKTGDSPAMLLTQKGELEVIDLSKVPAEVKVYVEPYFIIHGGNNDKVL